MGFHVNQLLEGALFIFHLAHMNVFFCAVFVDQEVQAQVVKLVSDVVGVL